MKKISTKWLSVAVVLALTQVFSCKKDDAVPEVIAGFSFAIDATEFKKVTFTNASQNFSKLEWDFGDNTAKSADQNPVHTYSALGKYTVVLVATSQDGKTTNAQTQEVTITDPNALLTALTGDISKTWRLVREGSATAKNYPYQVGPLKADGVTRDGIWWRFGKDEDLAKRPCALNDDYTFTRAGLTFQRDLKGDFYAGDGGIYSAPVEFSCQTVGATGTTKNKDGADITAWRNMTGTFVLTPGAKPTLKIVGSGAYMGLEKVATHAEVKVPQSEVTYDVTVLKDGVVDTLILVANYDFTSPPDGKMDAYWQFVFVHYDNSADEPPIPSPKPEAGFTSTVSGLTTTFTNTSKYGTSYNWDFGDGSSSASKDPSHTYANSGAYIVKMTVTNSAGTASKSKEFFVSANALTDANLQGAGWKVRAADNSLFVGPGLGDNSWFDVGEKRLKGTYTPDGAGEHWECLANDVFTFGVGGTYAYDSKGDVRNDGYFEGLANNGCFSDAQQSAVTNDGKKFKTASDHTYTFTPASGANRAKITVTNGPGGAVAFVGFYKPYTGGENGDKTKSANGGATSITYEVMGYAKSATTEYLFLSVDISAAKNGSSAWSFVLVR